MVNCRNLSTHALTHPLSLEPTDLLLQRLYRRGSAMLQAESLKLYQLSSCASNLSIARRENTNADKISRVNKHNLQKQIFY